MSEVRVKENESLDSALRRFKRSCAKAGVLSELRKREHYESPSVKRRKKSEAARAKKRKYKSNSKRRRVLLEKTLRRLFFCRNLYCSQFLEESFINHTQDGHKDAV